MRKEADSVETLEADLWGEMIQACWRGESATCIIRRDDGRAEEHSPDVYFQENLAPAEQEALRYVQGRVLDLGCGPGRVLLYLQRQGLAVTGIDISPLTVEVARQRGGCDVRVMSVTELTFPSGSFDTVLMLGNNLGLAGSLDATRILFRRLHALTSPQGLFIGHTIDPTATEDVEHLRYHEWNRQRGCYLGQIALRIEVGRKVSPWFNLVLFEKPVLQALLEETGWRAIQWIDGGGGYWVMARKD